MKKAVISLVVAIGVPIVMMALGALILLSMNFVRGQKNQKILKGLMTEFTETVSEFVDGDIVEEKSVYGKLNGNGNGIQYYGAVLVRKDDVEDMDSLTAMLDGKFEIIEFWAQSDNKITSTHLEHKTLAYDTPICAEDEYISICFYNSYHPDSELRDLAGH